MPTVRIALLPNEPASIRTPIQLDPRAPPLQVSFKRGGRPMNAIDLLTAQHREVENLFDECKKASTEEKLELFYALANLLVLHTSIEERHFYPAAGEGVEEQQIREALEEHLLVKRGLADILSLDSVDAEFDAKLEVLREVVAHHLREEEEQLFPSVQQALSKKTLEDVGADLERMTVELEEEEELYESVRDVDQLAQAAPLRPEQPGA